MPKKIEDIIVPERRRSIRDIPIPERRGNNNEYHPPLPPRDNFGALQIEKDYSIPPHPVKEQGWRKRKNVWMATGLALLVLIFAVFSIFNGATLAYVPKSSALSFDQDVYTARQTGEGGLLYSVIKLSLDKGLEVPASGAEEVQKKANGTIIIYNTTSSKQRLRATTRFETPDGKVYQVEDAITLPSKSVVGGVEKLGTLEVVVYAERPGEEFNIGLTDFILPGLKGTSLSSSIYARSKTKMSGGFAGVQKVVESGELARAKAELEVALRDELISEAQAQVPEDFILFPALSSVTFEDLPLSDSLSGDKAVVNIRADLSGVMFKRSDLSNYLALDKITRALGESVDIIELDSLNLAFVGTLPVGLSSNEIKFSVTGEAVAVWRTDEVALKADLIGKHKRDIPSILNNYPTVRSATTTIRPFWKKSFPSDSADISIRKLPAK